MTIPNKFLLTDLLHHNVRCDEGIDHGSGFAVWMYPPTHRIFGWFSRPSSFRLSREVWRLDQLRGIGNQDVYVKGKPASSDQLTLDRCPTLMYADLINNEGERIGLIADLVFESNSGKILYYLVSRTNPKLPGTSRWRLSVSLIADQQPGSVFCNLNSLEDLPIDKASIRQEFMNKSRKWRSQLQDMTYKATDRLEGWLDDHDNKDFNQSIFNKSLENENNFNDSWIDEDDVDRSEIFNRIEEDYKDAPLLEKNDSDPWI